MKAQRKSTQMHAWLDLWLLTSKKEKTHNRLPCATGLAPGGSSTTCQSNPWWIHGEAQWLSLPCRPLLDAKPSNPDTFSVDFLRFPVSWFSIAPKNLSVNSHHKITQSTINSLKSQISYSPPLCKLPRCRCLQTTTEIFRSTEDRVTIRRA